MEMWECKAVRADDRPFLSPPPLPFEWPTLLSGSASLPPIASGLSVVSARVVASEVIPVAGVISSLRPLPPPPLHVSKTRDHARSWVVIYT